MQRCTQLTEWTSDLALPKVVWLSGLFNPQSFLTAVMQTTARRNDWPLDKTVLLTEVTKKTPEQVEAPSRCVRPGAKCSLFNSITENCTWNMYVQWVQVQLGPAAAAFLCSGRT
jgi:hypothetical protein